MGLRGVVPRVSCPYTPWSLIIMRYTRRTPRKKKRVEDINRRLIRKECKGTDEDLMDEDFGFHTRDF